MDRHDAAFAAGLIGAGTVIPCHYNTFPPIETDAEAFKADVEDQSSSEVVILAPGETPRGLGSAGPARAAYDPRRDRASRASVPSTGRSEDVAQAWPCLKLLSYPLTPAVGRSVVTRMEANSDHSPRIASGAPTRTGCPGVRA